MASKIMNARRRYQRKACSALGSRLSIDCLLNVRVAVGLKVLTRSHPGGRLVGHRHALPIEKPRSPAEDPLSDFSGGDVRGAGHKPILRTSSSQSQSDYSTKAENSDWNCLDLFATRLFQAGAQEFPPRAHGALCCPYQSVLMHVQPRRSKGLRAASDSGLQH
jgi:hypothetical protein